jgi:STE24 endopeptidase
MLALQSGPAASQSAVGSLVGTVAALGATTLLATGAFSLYGRRLRGSGDATAALTRARRSLRWGLPVVYVVALLSMVAGGWLRLIDGIADSVPAGGTAVGDLVTVPSVAVLGGYLGLFPAVRDLRDVGVSATTALARLARWIAGLFALVVVLVAAVTAVSGGAETGLGFAAALALVVVAMLVGSPWIVRVTQTTRAPSDAERERLDRLCADAGLDPAGVRVLDTAGSEQAYAVVRGFPGRRHLFVTDFLLTELDDDRLWTYLALQAGRSRLYHLETRAAVVAASLGLASALLLGSISLPGVSDGVGALLALLAGGVGLWLGQRLVYRADRYAAERTSRDAVEATIEAFADLNDAPMDWGRLAAIRRMEPPLIARIDKLRDRKAAE